MEKNVNFDLRNLMVNFLLGLLDGQGLKKISDQNFFLFPVKYKQWTYGVL